MATQTRVRTGEDGDWAATLPAKRPVSPVAGPYGHPFHPIFVTVPIGAWIGALILDIGSRLVDDPTGLSRGAYWLVGIGIVGALVAAIFGFMDLLTIPRQTRALAVGLTHMTLNLIVVGLFVVNFLVRAGEEYMNETRSLPLVLTIVGLVVLAVSGWLGGSLAYHYGVRVAHEGAQAEGFKPAR
jgi:uncharacterized membrane protein